VAALGKFIRRFRVETTHSTIRPGSATSSLSTVSPMRSPRDGFTIAHFLTVADIERSTRYYEKVFDARILSLGDGNAPGCLELANIWKTLNVGGGPTPDKPTVTLSVPRPESHQQFYEFPRCG
jgi:hypothetical protein